MTLSPHHAPPPPPRRPAPPATARRGDEEHLQPGAARILDLQRSLGNRAVGALLRRPAAVQRAVGWPEGGYWNKGPARTADAQHRMLRFALAGLETGNKAARPDRAKTDEKAADESGARAVVWIHPDLDPAQPVQVLTHMHGFTERGADPFPGWRETSADPRSDESTKAKDTSLKDATKAWETEKEADPGLKRPKLADMPNPLANKVRDVERDRIAQQVEEIKDPQIMAVLPQGTGAEKTFLFGKDFDPDALVAEVLTRLLTESDVTKLVTKYTAVPTRWTTVLSAHSAGGEALTEALRKKRTGHVGGVILFDSLYGEPQKKDATKLNSPQRVRLVGWVRANCAALGKVLKEPVPADPKAREAYQKRMEAAMAALPGVRGFFESNYELAYRGLEAELHGIVDATIPVANRVAVKAKFKITEAKTTHDHLIGDPAATGSGTAPLEQALGERSTFVAPRPSP